MREGRRRLSTRSRCFLRAATHPWRPLRQRIDPGARSLCCVVPAPRGAARLEADFSDKIMLINKGR